MIHKIFTVYDSKVEAYLPPFYQQSKGAAIRAFTDTCNEAGHPFNKHPEDYTMFELGAFDDTGANFELHKTPISIGVAIEFINERENNAISNGPPVLASSRS